MLGLLTRVNTALNAATYPPTLAHELTHAAAAWPWARRTELDHAPWHGAAYCDVEWEADAPAWAIRVAAVAPTILGSAFALAVLSWIAVAGGSLPATGQRQAAWLAVGAYWLVFWAPSTADLRALADTDP